MINDRIDHVKSVRIVPQEINSAGTCQVVDNRLGGHRNYLSGAPLQRSEANEIGGLALQRKPSGALSKQGQESGVVQRTEYNDARKRFVYVSPADFANNINKQRIPYKGDTIQFTNYTPGTEILSAGFNGCFMMAFRFLRPSNIVTGFKLRELFQTFPPSRTGIFVAHVANNVKEAVQEAEYDDLISIEAIFRPYNEKTKGLPPGIPVASGLSAGLTGVTLLTGGMRLENGKWAGRLYSQERVPNPTDATHPITFPDARAMYEFRWYNGVAPLKKYDAGRSMDLQTLATKAFIYALVINDPTITDAARKTDALNRLRAIRSRSRKAIRIAINEISLSADPNDRIAAAYLRTL